MTEDRDSRIADALEQTKVLRPPRQALATFGATIVRYYVVTEPSYAELPGGGGDTVVREGTVHAQQPQVVTPFYMLHLAGFSHEAQRFFQQELDQQGPHALGLLYAYHNEPQGMNIGSGDLLSVAQRIGEDLDRRGEQLAAVVKGVDALWDVSLLKFIYEITQRSVAANAAELGARGLLSFDARGVPQEARQRIEELFLQVVRGKLDPAALKRELDRWDLFEEYQDRFYALFHR